MKKTILFPTDFTIESLKLLKNFLNQASNKEESYNVILLHGVRLSSSINDLLYFSKQKIIDKLETFEFNQSCFVLENKFASKINSFRKDIFTGFTQSAFNNYVEANKIDEVCLPTNFEWHLDKKKSFDIVPYIRKSNLTINNISISNNAIMPEKDKVAELFFNGAPSTS